MSMEKCVLVNHLKFLLFLLYIIAKELECACQEAVAISKVWSWKVQDTDSAWYYCYVKNIYYNYQIFKINSITFFHFLIRILSSCMFHRTISNNSQIFLVFFSKSNEGICSFSLNWKIELLFPFWRKSIHTCKWKKYVLK